MRRGIVTGKFLIQNRFKVQRFEQHIFYPLEVAGERCCCWWCCWTAAAAAACLMSREARSWDEEDLTEEEESFWIGSLRVEVLDQLKKLKLLFPHFVQARHSIFEIALGLVIYIKLEASTSNANVSRRSGRYRKSHPKKRAVSSGRRK